MKQHELVRELAEKNSSKIVMLVADGLGGPPVAGLPRDRVSAGPAAADADGRAVSLNDSPAGPRPVLAE